MDRELISKNIINIIDVKNCTKYEIFSGDDLYDVLNEYLHNLINNDAEACISIKQIMESNKIIIDKIVKNETITLYEKNHFMTDLILFKRKYLMK